ncbi:YqzM family protein [Oceanobacillus sp. CAU 1775]
MNEFEKNPQHKGNDIIEAGTGFVFSFVFFFLIFGIGVVFSVLGG